VYYELSKTYYELSKTELNQHSELNRASSTYKPWT